MPFDQDTLLAAAHAAPSLDPQTAYGISATTDDVTEAAQRAQATAAFGSTLKSVAALRGQDADTQRKIWGSLSLTEQKMYASAGYTVPAKQHHGLFDRAVGAVGHVAADVLGHVAEVPMHAIGEALHYAGAPLRQVQHLYRTSEYVDDVTPGRWALGSLSQWAKAWRETEHGEKSFLPSRVAHINRQYAPDVAELGRRLASGESANDIILSAPEEQRDDLARRLNDDADIKAATQDFEHAKMSFGRSLVSEHFWKSHPGIASKISGAADAIADVFADPIIWGGKIVKAAELAPYIIHDGARVGEMLDLPGAQRMLGAAEKAIKSGGVDELVRKFPRFAPIAEQLAKEDVRTADELKAWFQTSAGQNAILQGRVGGMAPHSILMRDPGAVVPNLSRAGAAAIPAKEATRKVIDFAAQHHIPLTRSLERITALAVPRGGVIKMNDPNSITYLQRLADYALASGRGAEERFGSARARELVNAFAAEKDRGKQFNIYKSLVSEVMDAMKVPAEYKDNFLGRLENAQAVHNYGIADEIMLDGQSTSAGFTVAHTRDHGWAVPDFRELRMQAEKLWLNQRLYGTVNGDLATGFMNRWKPAQLLRIGMPIRTAGEELVAAMLREGPLGLARARLAQSSLKEGEIAPIHPISASWEALTKHLPENVKAGLDKPSDLVGEVLGNRARRAFRYAEGRLAGNRYVEAAKKIGELFPDALPEEVSAIHAHGAGFLSDEKSVARVTRTGAKARPLYLKPDGTYTGYTPAENLMTHIWQKNLQDYGRDPLMKAAFDAAEHGEAAQVDAVMALLADDEKMGGARRWAVRNFQTSDGRIVGETATQEEAWRDWANVVVKNANNVTTDATGARFAELLDAVRNGEVVPIDKLNAIPHELRPVSVSGPRMIPVYGEGKWAQIQQHGFGYIGEMINWIAREPMYVHNMAVSLKEVEPFRAFYMAKEGATAEVVDRQLSEIASQRALEKTIPFIHDPAVRSQFAEDARNLAPFLFAQEQFIKRFARTFAYAPEAFREAQLTMMGLRHSGFIKKDADGNDYFVYPGVTFTQNALSKAVELVTGHPVSLPLPVGFSGQVRFATPGTERLGAPSWGPLVAVPMHAMAKRFPELTELEAAVVGERGAGRPFWEQVTPSSVARIVHAAIDNPESSPQMHSAMLQAIQYLEATGHGLKENANPLERERYIDRVKSWTRILFVTRAIYGFSVPAAPELQMDPNHLHEELSTLMGQLPIDQAMTEFIRRHPDATPYTVFQSKNQSGAPLPATVESMRFMEDHTDFLKKYPQAAAWFLPQAASGEFSFEAYREQMALGLRSRKSTEEFYGDLKFAEAADTYFATRDARDEALAKAKGNRTLTARINQQWAEFKDPYLKSHPVFEERLLSPDGQLRRAHAVSQIRDALNDGDLPQTAQNEAIGTMSATYDALQAYLGTLAGRRDHTATVQRKNATQQFVTWAHQYVIDHPEVKGLYDSVFRLEVGDNG